MTRFVGAAEAARQLGVQRATLYAYVSRGLVERRLAVDGRTSLYSVDDLDALARRGRQKASGPRPSLDVHIATSITTLDESGPRYRNRDVATLAASASYEQVAELLWTGALPDRVEWPPPDPEDIAAVLDGGSAAFDPLHRIIAATLVLGARHPHADAASFTRRLLVTIPAVLAGAEPPSTADPRLPARLAAVWDPAAPAALTSTLKRVLVVMADHELTTSTMAVRLAASVRARPADALVAGLSVLSGPLHGSAADAAHRLIIECAADGVIAVVERRLTAGDRLPGFGHKIYAADDPRVVPVREAIGLLGDPHGRLAVVDELVAVAGQRVFQRPNVDLALGALMAVAHRDGQPTAGRPADIPLFAIRAPRGPCGPLPRRARRTPRSLPRHRSRARPIEYVAAGFGPLRPRLTPDTRSRDVDSVGWSWIGRRSTLVIVGRWRRRQVSSSSTGR